MDEPEHDPRCWAKSGRWSSEPKESALARTPAFGQRFFAQVFKEFPDLAVDVVFLQWSEEPDDVYAVFELTDGGFGVQVEPCLEYIIVWGASGQAEYGNWGDEQVISAIAHVRYLVLEGSQSSG
jgi:hypothetical protein